MRTSIKLIALFVTLTLLSGLYYGCSSGGDGTATQTGTVKIQTLRN